MELFRDLLSWALILGGVGVILIGTYGLITLPDVFARMHGAGMTDTMGAALLLLGMLLQAPDWLVAVKLLCIAVFLGITSPTTSHALARAALHSGLTPWTRDAVREERTRETVP